MAQVMHVHHSWQHPECQELGLLVSWCQRDLAFPWPFS